MKKISFIVPVYNGEKYINRCVDSILDQQEFEINDVEILLLDDGSADDSPGILEGYKNAHPNVVRHIAHRNIGVAKTRNKGMRLAVAKYIMFLDQDDFIDPDYCRTLYDAAEEGGYDIVYSGMRRPNELGRIVKTDKYKRQMANTYFARFMCMAVWAKIYRTEFIRDNKLSLFDNPIGEDIAFTFEEAQKTNNILCITYTGYNWFLNAASVSSTNQQGLGAKNLKAIVALQDRLATKDIRKNNVNSYFATMITAYYIFFSGKSSNREQFLHGSKVLITNLKRHYPKFDRNRYLLKSPKGTLPIFAMGVKVFVVLHKLKLFPIFARIYLRDNRIINGNLDG